MANGSGHGKENGKYDNFVEHHKSATRGQGTCSCIPCKQPVACQGSL